MKKLMLILAVLVIAAPAMAASLSIEDIGSGWFAINYDKGAGEMPRAFALNVKVTDGVIDDYACSVSDATVEPFNVYMGNISIEDGSIVDRGSPVAPATAPDTPGQLDSNSIVIEMGSLYVPGTSDPCEPATSGTLIKLHCDAAGQFTVNVTSNALRGKVVLEDTTVEDLSVSKTLPDVCKGDTDGDNEITTQDMNNLMMHLYVNGDPGRIGRPAPLGPYPGLDIDGDGELTTQDLNQIMMHVYVNGDPGRIGRPAPCMP